MEAKREDFIEGMEVAKRCLTHPSCERRWNRGLFRLKRWESERHKSWGLQAEWFQGHVATDGSLIGVTGKWSACGWSVVQLDYDGELGTFAWHVWHNGCRDRGPAHHQEGGVDGFLCLLKKLLSPSKCTSTIKEI